MSSASAAYEPRPDTIAAALVNALRGLPPGQDIGMSDWLKQAGLPATYPSAFVVLGPAIKHGLVVRCGRGRYRLGESRAPGPHTPRSQPAPRPREASPAPAPDEMMGDFADHVKRSPRGHIAEDVLTFDTSRITPGGRIGLFLAFHSEGDFALKLPGQPVRIFNPDEVKLLFKRLHTRTSVAPYEIAGDEA